MPVLEFSLILVITYMPTKVISVYPFHISFLPLVFGLRVKQPLQEVSWQPIFQGYSTPMGSHQLEQVYRDK